MTQSRGIWVQDIIGGPLCEKCSRASHSTSPTANMTAKTKRSIPTDSDTTRGGSGKVRKTSGRNHGRQQLRKVERTARRHRPEQTQQDGQSDEAGEDGAHAETLDAPGGYSGTRMASERGETQPSAAFDALLTLLKSDQAKEKARSRRDIGSGEEKRRGKDLDESTEEGEMVGEDEEEIAGVVEHEQEDEVEDDEVEDEEDDWSDPFEVHFNQESEQYVEEEEKLLDEEKEKWHLSAKETIGETNYSVLYSDPPGKPLRIGDIRPTSSPNVEDYHLKNRVLDAYKKKVGKKLDQVDSHLMGAMLNYQDVSYPYFSYQNSSYRKLYATHAINHIYKTRDRILKNNGKLHNYHEAMKKGDGNLEEPEFKDQGFTRAKVLILLPTRDACYEVMNNLIALSGTEQQENKKKFMTQFHGKSELPSSKPDDFRDTFRGNTNDFFCIGMKFTRKTIKLYSSFYSSDIILASPIGLSMILEHPEKKKRQYDFLSSIEILVVDRANQIEMQNWDHVQTVLKYVNKIPKEFHDADFSRIRMWYLNDKAKFFRQNLVFAEFQTPEVNSIISRSTNLGGKVRFKKIVDSKSCIMNSIGLKLKQIFHRFECPSPIDDPEIRFKVFINSILPSITKSTSYDDGLMVFIPSYYDYLRVKSHMKKHSKISFGSIDEYSSQSKLTRVRQSFSNGKIKILLYTERLHHFRRYEINGVKTLIMYQAPSNPLFYKELVRCIGKSVFKEIADQDLSFIKILYSKWDAISLERIVGHERAPILCNSQNELYEFK